MSTSPFIEVQSQKFQHSGNTDISLMEELRKNDLDAAFILKQFYNNLFKIARLGIRFITVRLSMVLRPTL